MPYGLHCVPGNHPFTDDDPDKDFVITIDPRYGLDSTQRMAMYACGLHKQLLVGLCNNTNPHEAHSCPGIPE